MVKSDNYKQLMESLNRLFDVLPDMEDDEAESEGKARSITIVTIGKGQGTKIPKASAFKNSIKKTKQDEAEEYDG
jgi:hypothetical protein